MPDVSPFLYELRATYQELLGEHRYDEAIPLLLAALRHDDAQAAGIYGTLLILGRGMEQNLQEGAAWFRFGAQLGDLHAQVSLGVCLSYGLGMPANTDEAVDWLYRAAARGHQRAIEQLDLLVTAHPGLLGQRLSRAKFLALPRAGGKA